MSETNPTVEYRSIQGYPGYRVGSDGSVWSNWKKIYKGWIVSKHWRPLTLSVTSSGRQCVHLMPGKKFKLVHRLVLEAFVGPCPPGMMTRHFPDKSPLNNQLSNLQWGTSKENHDDQVVHHTSTEGERNPAAKLSPEQVKLIRQEYTEGKTTQQALADKYGVCQTCISHAITHRTWR